MENMFLAMFDILSMQVYPASVVSYWAYVPHPPLLHPVGWGDDVNIRVMTNDTGLMGEMLLFPPIWPPLHSNIKGCRTLLQFVLI